MAYLLRLWKVIVRRIKKTPGPCGYLRRKRHDHPHDPRHLHARISTRSTSIKPRPSSGPRSSCSSSCRGTSIGLQLLRRQGAAVPQVQARRRNRPIHQRKVPLQAGRLDRHRPDRGPGGHRRQQRQLPRTITTPKKRPFSSTWPRPRKSPGNCGSATWAA